MSFSIELLTFFKWLELVKFKINKAFTIHEYLKKLSIWLTEIFQKTFIESLLKEAADCCQTVIEAS